MSHTTYPASPQRRQGALATSRRRLAPALLACASLLGATPAFAVDWQTPQYGDDRIDVQNYNLALEIQPSLTAISGVVTMQVRPTVATRDFTLDLHALKVSNVTVGGLKAAYTQTNDKLRITPTTGLRQNQVVTVQVTYAGSPSGARNNFNPPTPVWEVNAQRKTLHFGAHNGLSFHYFPCNQVSTDKATYSFAITVPKGLVAVAPGLPQAAKPAGLRTTTYPFLLAQEISPQDVSLTVGPFRVDTATLPSGLRLQLYTMADVTDTAAFMASFRQAAESSERLWGAYRFPSMSAVASEQYGDISRTYWQRGANVTWYNGESNDYLTAPEFFNNALSNAFLVSNLASLSEVWFKDGLESYTRLAIDGQSLYEDSLSEDAFGELEYFQWMSIPSPLDPGFSLGFENNGPSAYAGYARGTWMMADLEYRLGQPMVNKILRSWVALQRTRPVTTTDFVSIATTVSRDPGVVNLLNRWIYDAKFPTPAFVTEAASGN
jgi:hypothetical protein